MKYLFKNHTLIIIKNNKPVYGFKIKFNKDFNDFYKNECNRTGYANDYFLKTQIDYNG